MGDAMTTWKDLLMVQATIVAGTIVLSMVGALFVTWFERYLYRRRLAKTPPSMRKVFLRIPPDLSEDGAAELISTKLGELGIDINRLYPLRLNRIPETPTAGLLMVTFRYDLGENPAAGGTATHTADATSEPAVPDEMMWTVRFEELEGSDGVAEYLKAWQKAIDESNTNPEKENGPCG